MPKARLFNRPSLHLDYFRDNKNRINQVLTWSHPNDRKLCIVKYNLGDGYWTARDTGITYKRILSSYSFDGYQENLRLIKEREPDYLFHSEVYGVDFLAVPNHRIKEYYYPEARLQEIIEQSTQHKLEPLEEKVLFLAEKIHDCLGIPLTNIGISGSILWKGQTPKSDIDMMIYGNEYAQNFNQLYPQIFEETKKIIPMNKAKRRKYELSMSRKTGLPQKVTKKYISKKTWLGMFDETDLSMIFSPLPEEIPFDYGEQIFIAMEPVEISATISDTTMGFAYPAIYGIENIEILSKGFEEISQALKRVFSFEGALTGYFKQGEEVVIRGLLEKVFDKKRKKSFYQIMLGTKECQGNEFIIYNEDYPKNRQF